MNPFTRMAKRWSPATSILALILAANAAYGQLTASYCGGEGEPACGPNNPAYSANNDYYYDTSGKACDYGLKATSQIPSVCVNDTRLSFDKNTILGREIEAQEYGIGADTPINWLNIMGTHNSFSNSDEGSHTDEVTDQTWSITDQLQLGARNVMLDVHFYDGQMRLCHNSLGDDDFFCRSSQNGRLYLNAIKEIAYWLKQNPGEFLILRLNNQVDDSDTYLLNDPIRTYLGNKVFSPLEFNSQGAWPTLRQLRALGKQVLIFGSNPTDLIFSYATWFTNEAQPNTDGLEQCKDFNGRDVRTRAFDAFAYVAEDRSRSASTYPYIQGDLTADLIAELDACGFTLIDVDFLNALSNAVVDPESGPDTRPQASVWSLATGALPTTGTPMLMENLKWKPAHDGNEIHPFACAGSGWGPDQGRFPNVYFPQNHPWKITEARDVWAAGDATCQREFGSTYHFWAPGTGVEQTVLINNGFATIVREPVWLNYVGGPLLTGAPNSLTIKWNKSQAIPAPQTMILRGGQGGALRPWTNPADYTQPFFTSANTHLANSNTVALSIDQKLASNLNPGTYSQAMRIDETDPVTGQIITNYFPVTLQITDTVLLDTAAVTLANCDGRQSANVSVKSGGAFTTESSASWVQIAADRYVAPATLRVTVDPTALSVGPHVAWVKVIAPGTTNGGVAFQVNLTVKPQTIINSSPDTTVSIAVDGKSYAGVNGFCWAAGSQHIVAASPSDVFNTGTRWEFSSWTDGGATAHTITQPNSAISLTAHYVLQYQVSATVNHHHFGSIYVSPASTDGYYAANTQLSFTANPNNGHRFSDFQVNGATTTANPLVLQLQGPTHVTAEFTQ